MKRLFFPVFFLVLLASMPVLAETAETSHGPFLEPSIPNGTKGVIKGVRVVLGGPEVFLDFNDLCHFNSDWSIRSCTHYIFDAFTKENSSSVFSDGDFKEPLTALRSTFQKVDKSKVLFEGTNREVHVPIETEITIHAQTPIECIHEVECAAFAFFKAFSPRMLNGPINRWGAPRKYSIIGGTPELQQEARDVLQQIPDFEEAQEGNNEKANFVVMLSSNFRSDLEKYRPHFDKKVEGTEGMYRSFHKLEAKIQQSRCAGIPVAAQFRDTYTGHLVLVKDTEPKNIRRLCYRSALTSGLGFTTLIEGFPFSARTTSDDDSPIMTSLDIFLYKIASQPEFERAQAYQDIESRFTRAYSNVLKSLQQLPIREVD